MKIILNEKERIIFEYAKYIFFYAFYALLTLFLLILLLHEFYPEKINTYFNINMFMLIVIIFGILSILFPPNKKELYDKKNKKPFYYNYLLILALGILSSTIIFLKTKSTESTRYLISILGGLIVALLSWLVLTEEKNDKT